MRKLLATIGVIGVLLSGAVAVAQDPLRAMPLDSIQVLRISPSDERAVLRMPDGTLQMIKVGDAIGNLDGRVTEIASGRVVVEENVGGETETVIVRLEGDRQRVERISRKAEPAPPLFAPPTPADSDRGQQGAGRSFVGGRYLLGTFF
jgi:hypothetical protein